MFHHENKPFKNLFKVILIVTLFQSSTFGMKPVRLIKKCELEQNNCIHGVCIEKRKLKTFFVLKVHSCSCNNIDCRGTPRETVCGYHRNK